MITLILVLIILLVCTLLIILGIKYFYLKHSIIAIENRLKLINDETTNLLIDVPSNDKNIRNIVYHLNENVKLINKSRKKMIYEEEAIKSTITNLSHDLRTPTASILGYIQLLSDTGNLTKQQQDYLQIIEGRIQILKSLIEELFDYSVVNETKKLILKKENVNSILEESLLVFYEDFKTNKFNVSLSLQKNSIYKNVDKTSLKRVFNNIISNSLKYGIDEFKIIQEENYIIFENKTHSMDKIDVEKIFDRFFTIATARTNGSMGLGLTICKILIEKMNGQIKANLNEDYLQIIVSFND